MDGLDSSQKEFLEILVYLFLQYNKFDEAFALTQVLAHYFPHDPLVELSLAFAALQSDSPSTALNAIKITENIKKSNELEKLFFVLKSKTMWALGRDSDARSAFTHFLGIQEQDLRLAAVNNNKNLKG